MNLKEDIKTQTKSCTDSMDNMVSDKAKVACLEDCAIKETDITEVGSDGFTMDSAVCVAFKKAFKGKDDENKKEFGVIRVINTEKVNGSIPP